MSRVKEPTSPRKSEIARTGSVHDLPVRARRLRSSDAVRAMVRETLVTPANLIHPLFVVPDSRPRAEIGSMPGVFQNPVRAAVDEAKRAWDLGIKSVLLFGLPESKDAIGSPSWDPEGPVQRAIRQLKKEIPEMVTLADVCMCEYTDHGHCGVLVEHHGRVDVDNDQTLDLLVKQSLSYVEAGVDFVAPSDMMDGRVGAIRDALDAEGRGDVGIVAYSAKFASGFYGPFREAAESAPKFGDRRSYQMDPPNAREAMREIELDIAEGADMVMVKPALSYLDVIKEARMRFDLPIVAYNVSGEYAMVKAAEKMGWIDGPRVADEILTSIRRAGADLIITYHAIEWSERHGKRV
ncbi:MAG TPA: porphobilinogen synthase [Thermoanaerobaculia bacterium]